VSTERNPVLTPAQRHTLDTLVGMVEESGHAPRLHELAVECGVSVTAVRACLDKLETKGFIRRTPYVDRGIEILKVSA